MTTEEEKDLRALGEQIARADQSPWEPRCVVRAFRREPLVVAGITLHPLTLSGYLRLSEIRSPLLSGRWPEDGVELLEAIAGAASVFGGELWTIDRLIESIAPEEVAILRDGLETMTRRAFSTVLKMEFPRTDGAALSVRRGGFGLFPFLYTSLLMMGISREEALEMPLDEVFVIRATAQFIDGADVAGETYRQMEPLNNIEADAMSLTASFNKH